MQSEKQVLIGAGIALSLLLGVLFGMPGLVAGIILSITTSSVYCVLKQFGIESLFSFAFSIPAGIIILSSVSYLLGFLIGIRMAAIVTLILMLAISTGSHQIIKRIYRKP